MIKEIGKMTITFNRDIYGALLARYQPKVIITEEENEQALALAQEIEHRKNRTIEEEELLELLITLIEKFEEKHYPILQGKPQDTLRHLLEENNLKQEDLVEILGSRGVISKIVNGERMISKAQAKALAKFFNVDVGLFI
jgi:HTH-type transcriptional regulator/antitoxin HigA